MKSDLVNLRGVSQYISALKNLKKISFRNTHCCSLLGEAQLLKYFINMMSIPMRQGLYDKLNQ